MQGFAYSSISCFEERPSEHIRYLVKRQLPKLIQLSIHEATEFINTSQTKAKALQQLKYTILIGEGEITNMLDTIVRALIRIKFLDIEGVDQTIEEIMQIIGYHVKSSVYLPLMIDLLQQEDIKTNTKNTIILLQLIGSMLGTAEQLEQHVDQLLGLVKNYEKLFVENDEGLAAVSKIVITLINRLPHLSFDNFVTAVFSVLLNVQSTKTMNEKVRKESIEAMEVLAKKGGYGTVAELHSQEVGPFLEALLKTKQYRSWNKTSKNRFKFDTIVRNCQTEVTRFLADILTVLESCIHADSDVELRMDTLVLVQFLLNNPNLHNPLRQHSLQLLKILNIAIKWKVGKPQIKIRKAGMINLINMIENQLVSSRELLNCFDEFLPQIKSCISDDWAPELRLATAQFMEKYLKATGDDIDEQLKQIYVVLLERLDDSQDPIRKKATVAINRFFLCRYLKHLTSISSTLQYMINGIFVHYDDNNVEIRDAVNVSLRLAAKVDPDMVLKGAKQNYIKMKHKEQCTELIEYCKDVIMEKDKQT